MFELEHIGFKDEVKMIKEHWKMYVDLSGETMEPNFKFAFPKHILEHCAIPAFEATKAIKCQIANHDLKNEVYNSLNTAWQKVINDPLDYIGWEKCREREIRCLI